MNRPDAKLTVQEFGRYSLDEELIKTNMIINEVRGGEPILAKRVASMELTIGSKTLSTSSLLRYTVAIILFLGVIGFMQINVYLRACTGFLSSGLMIKLT